MPKFHYAKFGKSWGVESVVDDATYNAARDMFAECFGIKPEMLEYIVFYGVKQTTQDSAAQPHAAAKQAGDDAVAAYIAAADKRWDKINLGTVAVRAGFGRVTDPFQSAVNKVTAEKLAAFIKTDKGAKAKATLKGASKETKALVVKKFYEANKTAIVAEANRRLADATASVAVELDLSDLTA